MLIIQSIIQRSILPKVAFTEWSTFLFLDSDFCLNFFQLFRIYFSLYLFLFVPDRYCFCLFATVNGKSQAENTSENGGVCPGGRFCGLPNRRIVGSPDRHTTGPPRRIAESPDRHLLPTNGNEVPGQSRSEAGATTADSTNKRTSVLRDNRGDRPAPGEAYRNHLTRSSKHPSTPSCI